MGAPKKPVEMKGQLYLSFIDPNDDTKVFELSLVDTGTTNPVTGNKIYAQGITGSAGPIPVLIENIAYGNMIGTGSAFQFPNINLINGTIVTALQTNTNPFYIGGGAGVNSAIGTPLYPGESIFISCKNLDAIWVIGTLADELRHIGG